MRPRITTRLYTNCILTAIAVLLGLLTLHSYRIAITPSAYAQDEEADPTPLGSRRFSAPGRSAPLDLSNVSQTQDTAVAAATTEVASANREIASALREVAIAIREAGTAIGEDDTAAPATGTTSGAASGTPRPGDQLIEVGPARAR